MRRRNQLQVNTFPFLAVLLCAMGALILVLLVMDRKAKLAAVAKAQEKAQKVAQEHASRATARKREADAKRKTAVAAWEKRRDDLRATVTAEKRQLDDELKRVEARLAEAAARLRREENAVQQLRTRVTAEKTRLQQQEQAVADAKREAAGLTDKAAEAEAVKKRLAAELEQLEKALAQIHEARKRDAETYSVVPYHGKRGDSRRPLYVECAAAGLIFHPDRQVVEAEMPVTVRQEVERRVTAQREELAKQGISQARPYLMLLIRPEGIVRRYQLESAIRGLGVDFGYELVDADWKLHFPPADETRTASAGKPAPPPSPVPPAPVAKKGASSGVVSLMPPASSGRQAGPVSGGPERGGPGFPAPASSGGGTDGPQLGLSLPPVQGSAGGPGNSTPGAGIALPQPSPEPPADALPGNRSPAAVGLSRPQPYGATGDGAAADTKPGDGGIALPPILPSTGSPRQEASGAGPSRLASRGQPGGASAEPGETARDGGGRQPGFQGPTPAPGDSDRREIPLRPARITNPGDLTIFVECRADSVVVYPTRKMYALSLLHQTPVYNPLYQTVRDLMRRHLATGRPDGSTPRVQIRFLVHPDAERTYHQTYPALETVSVPKTRSTLLPEDDVGRIVSGF